MDQIIREEVNYLSTHHNCNITYRKTGDGHYDVKIKYGDSTVCFDIDENYIGSKNPIHRLSTQPEFLRRKLHAEVKKLEHETPDDTEKHLEILNYCIMYNHNYDHVVKNYKRYLNHDERLWDMKVEPYSGEKNYLFTIYQIIIKKINSLSSSCINCDKAFEVVMYQPTTCNDTRCMFSTEQFGFGTNVITEIKTRITELELLVYFTVEADINRSFDPFPEGLGYSNDQTGKNKINDVIRQIVTKNYNVEWLEKNSDARRLLQWIVATNRSYLVYNDSPEVLKLKNDLGMKHIFEVKCKPPEHEARFREMKAKHGSRLVYHGSPLGNWHSILRNCLKDCSVHDKYKVVNGAMYGRGIYCDTDVSTPKSYARSGCSDVTQFKGMNCLAICEIILYPEEEGQIMYATEYGGTCKDYYCNSRNCSHEKVKTNGKRGTPYIRVHNEDLISILYIGLY